MDTSALDGYKKLIVTACTLLGALVSVFITDPAKAETIGGFITSTVPTIVITLVGIIYTIVQGNIDKEKARTAATEARSQAIMSQEASPKDDSAPVEQPAVAPIVQAAPVETYKPIDLDAYVAAAEESVKADGLIVDPLTRATYFWPCMTNFDLRPVPRQFRISESKRLYRKHLIC